MTEGSSVSSRPDIVSGWVSVVLTIDGEEKDLGRSLFMFERGEDPADFATAILKAWEEAHGKADRTLRLFGAEGVVRAAMTEPSRV